MFFFLAKVFSRIVVAAHVLNSSWTMSSSYGPDSGYDSVQSSTPIPSDFTFKSEVSGPEVTLGATPHALNEAKQEVSDANSTAPHVSPGPSRRTLRIMGARADSGSSTPRRPSFGKGAKVPKGKRSPQRVTGRLTRNGKEWVTTVHQCLCAGLCTATKIQKALRRPSCLRPPSNLIKAEVERMKACCHLAMVALHAAQGSASMKQRVRMEACGCEEFISSGNGKCGRSPFSSFSEQTPHVHDSS